MRLIQCALLLMLSSANCLAETMNWLTDGSCANRECFCPKLKYSLGNPASFSGLKRLLAQQKNDIQAVTLGPLRAASSGSLETPFFAQSCTNAVLKLVRQKNHSGRPSYTALVFSAAYPRNWVADELARHSWLSDARKALQEPFSWKQLRGYQEVPKKYFPEFENPADVDNPRGKLYAKIRANFVNPHLVSHTYEQNDSILLAFDLEGDPLKFKEALGTFHSNREFGLLGKLVEYLRSRAFSELPLFQQEQLIVSKLNECQIQEAEEALARGKEEIELYFSWLDGNEQLHYCSDYYLSAINSGAGWKSDAVESIDTILLLGRPKTSEEVYRYFAKDLGEALGNGLAAGISSAGIFRGLEK